MFKVLNINGAVLELSVNSVFESDYNYKIKEKICHWNSSIPNCDCGESGCLDSSIILSARLSMLRCISSGLSGVKCLFIFVSHQQPRHSSRRIRYSRLHVSVQMDFIQLVSLFWLHFKAVSLLSALTSSLSPVRFSSPLV